jgi:hypothetical protein
VIVAEGTVYKSTEWILASAGTITVDTTAETFTQLSGGGVTRTSLGATGKYATTVGDGTTTTFTITHALSTTDVTVQTYSTDSAGVATVQQFGDVTVVDANTVSVSVSLPVPAASGNAGRLRVVVVG